MNPYFSPLPRRVATSQRGVALVMVLAMLVLVTGLIVAFLVTVRTDLSSSVSYEKATSSRLLAETALNLVIGQIQEATQRQGEAWISQPGLIRTFDASGSQASSYKLYSAAKMKILDVPGNPFDPAAGEDLPAGGRADLVDEPNVWADLNEPLMTTQIVNGAPEERFLYPIIDPGAKGEVKGFDYQDEAGKWSSITTAAESVAMPVRWLYLMKDGSVAPGEPAGGTGETVTVAGSSAANPPVARLAFWTDDESSKVNINTASAGTPWDTPVASVWPEVRSSLWDNRADYRNKLLPRPEHWPDTFFEIDFAMFQPAQHEYQRYPGHPATTTLMPVLGVPVAKAGGLTEEAEIKEALIALNPRYRGGDTSSKGGTLLATAPLQLKSERFYASQDELLYSAQYDSDDGRLENDIEINSDARRDFLEKAKFFITTSSRAPEVTLSNRPRVVSWPVHELENPAGTTNVTRSSFDELIAFCGTVGAGADAEHFYFTRSNPLSTHADWTTKNRRLYGYLQLLTSTAIPGFGDSFATKFGSDRDQVLTQIVDYIRSLNLQDPTVDQSYTNRTDNSTKGMVLPLIPPTGSEGAGTRGFGRFVTITELGILVVNRQPTTQSGAPGPAPGFRRIQVALLPEIYSPMVGYSVQAVNMKVAFEGLDRIRINGAPVPFPANQAAMFTNGIPTHWGSSAVGGNLGLGALLRNDTGGGPGGRSVPPVSSTFDVPEASGNFTINQGSRVTVKIQAPFTVGGAAVANPPTIQTFEFVLDRDVVMSLPTPTSSNQPIIPEAGYSSESRIEKATTTNGPLGVIGSNDRMVSLVPSGASADIQSDHRLIAADASANDSGRFFSVHPNAGAVRAHSLRSAALGGNGLYRDFSSGLLVAGVTGYGVTNTVPDVAPSVSGVTMTSAPGVPGDWDNGPALNADGAFVNKADEGAGLAAADTGAQFRDRVPYIGHTNYTAGYTYGLDATLFSPNRQMPSPIMFGSLPVGVKRGLRWQTLHFRPDWLIPAALPGNPSHPGAASPPDHLMLDNFWMPVVEPYAISEPFSTAGKINLNYQIAPFSYIHRDSGVRAVLATGLITALDPASPNAVGSGVTLINRYKTGRESDGQGFTGSAIRFGIDSEATLKFFDERFSDNRPFISASEICTVPLVPDRKDHLNQPLASEGDSPAQLRQKLGSFWAAHRLTGDNSLERPYAHIYPRVTTKSNTFNVHVRVQRLATSPASAAAGEFGGTDRVTGEFRGSFLIERYLDPNSDTFDMSDEDAVLGPYKFRVLSSKQLAK